MAVDCHLGLSSLADMLGDMSNVTSDLLKKVDFSEILAWESLTWIDQ